VLQFFSNKDIKISSIGSISIKFAAAFFGFLNGVLLARFLSLEGLGVYVLVFSTVTLLSVPTTLGLPNLLIRYISKYEVLNQFALVKGLLIKSNLIATYITLLVYLLAFVSYFFWWGSYDKMLVETIFYGLLLLPLLSYGSLRSAALKGLRYVILADLPESLLRSLIFSILLLTAQLSGYNLSPKLAMIYQLIAAFIAFVIGYLFLNEKLLKNLKGIRPLYDSKVWIKESIPFSINAAIQIIRTRLLIYLLAIFGSIEAVALFEVATKGANLVSFILNALNSAISPYISKSFEEGNLVYLQKILKVSARIIFVFSLPIALIFIIGGRSLLMYIFGNEYAGSYIPLVILCLGQLVSALTGSVGLLLNMTGHQKYFSRSNLWMLLLNVIFSIPFIVVYDVSGAAFVFSALLVLQNIILYLFVKRRLNLNTTVF
tara:strand:- start:25577 stop:26869 length:1293 start_codon:yes stop_codon:yes gene_type:complete